jgi:hypothetical protein
MPSGGFAMLQMKLFKLFFVGVLWASFASAQEPGFLQNPHPPSADLPSQPLVLTAEFARARGLHGYEVRALQYQRVACERRIYTANGWSIEGDADIKITDTGVGLIEANLPSQINFTLFGGPNPYQNGIASMETLPSRRLLNVRYWIDGQILSFYKNVKVTFVDEALAPLTALAKDEIKVIDHSYPETYLVRETVFIPSEFQMYFICQN